MKSTLQVQALGSCGTPTRRRYRKRPRPHLEVRRRWSLHRSRLRSISLSRRRILRLAENWCGQHLDQDVMENHYIMANDYEEWNRTERYLLTWKQLCHTPLSLTSRPCWRKPSNPVHRRPKRSTQRFKRSWLQSVTHVLGILVLSTGPDLGQRWILSSIHAQHSSVAFCSIELLYYSQIWACLDSAFIDFVANKKTSLSRRSFHYFAFRNFRFACLFPSDRNHVTSDYSGRGCSFLYFYTIGRDCSDQDWFLQRIVSTLKGGTSSPLNAKLYLKTNPFRI